MLSTPAWARARLRRLLPASVRTAIGQRRTDALWRRGAGRFVADHVDDLRGEVLVDVASQRHVAALAARATVWVVDRDPKNPVVTHLADLEEPGSLPPGRFDAVVLPQALHHLADPAVGLRTAWEAVAPGGVLLVTLPEPAPGLELPQGRVEVTPAGGVLGMRVSKAAA